MSKLFLSTAALALLLTSGCCQLFGVCTSASVHTSINTPQRFASSSNNVDTGFTQTALAQNSTLGCTN
jgi:hypothetical protein